MKLIDLGWCMGRLNPRKKSSGEESLIIASPSCSLNERLYQPAESVTIYGREAMLSLRDALNEEYPAQEEETPCQS